jgi:hypothetical protein
MKNFNKSFKTLGYRTPNWFLRGLKNAKFKNRKIVDFLPKIKKKDKQTNEQTS